jgi:hypothetical protein
MAERRYNTLNTIPVLAITLQMGNFFEFWRITKWHNSPKPKFDIFIISDTEQHMKQLRVGH